MNSNQNNINEENSTSQYSAFDAFIHQKSDQPLPPHNDVSLLASSLAQDASPDSQILIQSSPSTQKTQNSSSQRRPYPNQENSSLFDDIFHELSSSPESRPGKTQRELANQNRSINQQKQQQHHKDNSLDAIIEEPDNLSFNSSPVNNQSYDPSGSLNDRGISPSIGFKKVQSRPSKLQFSPPTARYNRISHPTTTGSYSSERLPWSTLRHYSDGSFVASPLQSSYATAENFFPTSVSSQYDSLPHFSRSLDDGLSLFSVIMDDGSKQRRKVSLTSETSPILPRVSTSDNDPLLPDENDSDSDYFPTFEDMEEDPHRHRYTDNCFHIYKHRAKSWIRRNTRLSLNAKNIIKCALAYFLASMFTYIPKLNQWVGLTSAKNSHLVGAVAVFFNPAKSIGGILEAVKFALFGGLYAVLISVGSMASAVWFNKQELYTLGHVVSVIIWCGGSMFITAFLKATLKEPFFNNASSLSNIIIFITLTKEGSVILGEFSTSKIFQVTTIVLLGVSISFLVSVLVWPVSASDKLKADIGKTLGSFRLLLKLLTKTFLIDDIHYTDKSVQAAIASHRATFTSLEASLNEAKSEIFNRQMQRELELYREIVKSLQRLAQHLGGLRSCCGLQWEMLKEMDKNGDGIPLQEGGSQRRPSGNFLEEEDYGDLGVLLEFISHVGPHMKSLAYTCKQTMIYLQDQFGKNTSDYDPTLNNGPSFSLLQQNLQAALSLFETSQTRAVTRLYKKESSDGHFDGRPNEEVFLIYFFVFNLQEFTRELERLVVLVGGINQTGKKESAKFRKGKWWQWWNIGDGFFGKNVEARKDVGADSKLHVKPQFPEHSHNLYNTLQTPEPKTKWQAFTMRIWKWSSCFRRFEVKYAFKAAVSAAILAAPAFIEYTRPTFVKYRGEWACISMMVVMVPTVGGTNLMGLYRVLGTFFGSGLAFVIYSLFPDNAPVLALFGFFIALPCFYILLHTKYNRMGQFILLGYNLVALYKFNLRNEEDEDNLDIGQLALYRGVAVSTGVLWGVYVTSYWWPYEARTELRKGLSLLIINMSWLYKKLVALYSHPPQDSQKSNRENDDLIGNSIRSNANAQQTAITLTQSKYHLSTSTKEFMELELFLQVSIIELRDLLGQTPNEPRLKGPFPVHTYGKILNSCQNILDKMLSMRIAVTKEQFYEAIRRDFIIPINRELRELVGNMLLYFYILAAALRLKTPLPPYLPPADQARRRMVQKIRDLPVVRQRVVEGNDEHYIVYYAYALVMEDIIRELENLGAIMQELFGTMGGEDFDALFASSEDYNPAAIEDGAVLQENS
ncbi:hypothetical protein G9A89_023901 [Geosiphon pyriformis]|nr:hypothetical protein G9A89_023901 [Geosiphon pyriformis]